MSALSLTIGLASLQTLAAQPILSQTEILGHNVMFVDRSFPELTPVSVRVYVAQGDSTDAVRGGIRLETMESVVEELWNSYDTLGDLGLDRDPLTVTFDAMYAAPQNVQFKWPTVPQEIVPPGYTVGRDERMMHLVEAILLEALKRHGFYPDDRSTTRRDSWRLDVVATQRPRGAPLPTGRTPVSPR